MAWYSFIDVRASIVFSPKVTPDPIAAERLNEKFQLAAQNIAGPIADLEPQTRLRIVRPNE